MNLVNRREPASNPMSSTVIPNAIMGCVCVHRERISVYTQRDTYRRQRANGHIHGEFTIIDDRLMFILLDFEEMSNG
jgi:hypothetical protein